MSLMKLLAKVAIGVAVGKGVKSVMNNNAAKRGGLSGGHGASRSGGDLGNMLGGFLGGSSTGRSGGAMSGGLGGMLENLGGTKGRGGLQDMLTGLAGGAGAGGLLGALSGKTQARPQSNNANFGEVLNSAFDATPQAEIEPSADQEAAAALMLRAMIQAAKSDGTLDDDERQKLLGHLGDDVEEEEAEFVRAEMQKPVDVDALVRDTPRGMEAQVYAMSLMAITLDNQAEAQYLDKLAKAYGLDPHDVNDIHAELDAPSLYT